MGQHTPLRMQTDGGGRLEMSTNERDGGAMQPEWLRYEEAQRLCGIGRTKLWQLGSRGDVKLAKVGRSVRISRRSLLEYMERQAE